MSARAMDLAWFLAEPLTLNPATLAFAKAVERDLREGRRWIDPVPRGELSRGLEWNREVVEVLRARGRTNIAAEVEGCGQFGVKVTLADGRTTTRRRFCRRYGMCLLSAWAEAVHRTGRPAGLMREDPSLVAVAARLEVVLDRREADRLLRSLHKSRQKHPEFRGAVLGGEVLFLDVSGGVEVNLLALGRDEGVLREELLAFAQRRGVGLHRERVERRELVAFFRRAVQAMKERGPIAATPSRERDHRSFGICNATSAGMEAARGRRRLGSEGPPCGDRAVVEGGRVGDQGRVGSISKATATDRSNPPHAPPSTTTTQEPVAAPRSSAEPLPRAAAEPPSTDAKGAPVDATRSRSTCAKFELVRVGLDDDCECGEERWQVTLDEQRRLRELEAEAVRMAEADDFTGARPEHFVGLHAVCHRRVYCVEDQELERDGARRRATSVVASVLRKPPFDAVQIGRAHV